MHCKWPHELDADWLRFFVGCSPSVVCCTKSFVDFYFFSMVLISWIIKDIGNTPHRRLEIKEVSEQGSSDPDQLATHILKITTTGKDLCIPRLTCKLQQWSQFQEPVWLLITMAHSVYSIMVAISSCLNVSNKRIGSVPKNLVPSQHLRQSNKSKTEQPFLSSVEVA